MPRKLIGDSKRRTHPLVWLAAVLCTILSIAVIVAGTVIFIGFLVIHPRVPTISVAGAHLNAFRNDAAGQLEVRLTVLLEAKNENARAHARFTDWSFFLQFLGLNIAQLVADPLDVRKNGSIQLHYAVDSFSIPLSPERIGAVDSALKADLSRFELKGEARVRWRFGLLGSVRFLCRLRCDLRFHPSNGTYLPSPCTSTAK